MNKFENLITDEYLKNHAINLLKENLEIAETVKDITDPNMFMQHQMSINVMNRYVYLALVKYHQSLAEHLREHGLELPDFATLTGTLDE